ncbi:DUF4912 domain-containing protein [Endomicrobium proavitum]|uniref:DUF4912 domain-containing protein n=1 Tax=Endomicrobium proavitum TaxID=1408281 RepID=A0A0G3WLF6_9BACT|nr:DUF4912 domain-containing protein [Endomicrobium proavitum]AKL98339.1 hypothetical protein Epro_0960 [Endomicrobium proavitum]
MGENLSSKIQNKQEDAPSRRDFALPSGYNDTKIVVLPKDPVCIFVYWEISSQTSLKFAEKYGANFDADSLAVRIYDITGVRFNGNNANKYFDVKVRAQDQSRYINLGEFNRVWCVDLCYVLKNGEIVFITRSNIVEMPRHGISDITDQKWALVQSEFEKLLTVPSGLQEGSYGLVKLMRKRKEEIISISSSGGKSKKRAVRK